jgi:hypothetical protein
MGLPDENKSVSVFGLLHAIAKIVSQLDPVLRNVESFQ